MKPHTRTTPDGGLSPKQEVAALAVSSGCTVRVAALRAGISERQCHAWLKLAPFKMRVGELRASMLASTAGQMTRGARLAVGVLARLLRDESPQVRLSAAKALAELSLKYREQVDVAEEIAELKAALAAREGRGLAPRRRA